MLKSYYKKSQHIVKNYVLKRMSLNSCYAFPKLGTNLKNNISIETLAPW